MKFEILSHFKNLLLRRDEIKLQILSESNPSFEDVKKHLGKNPELVVVKKVKGNFGTKKFSAEAFVYDSQEARDKTEIVPRKVRKKLAEEAKKKAEEEKAKAGVTS